MDTKGTFIYREVTKRPVFKFTKKKIRKRVYLKRTMCIRQGEAKNWNLLPTLSLDCFIRWMIQVFIFHIDFTFPIAKVTDNGRQYWLNRENAILDHNLEVLQCFFFFFFKLDISTAKCQKDVVIFYVSCYH